jgi:hypothetical protein
MKKPPIVSAQEWDAAREKMLVREKDCDHSRGTSTSSPNEGVARSEWPLILEPCTYVRTHRGRACEACRPRWITIGYTIGHGRDPNRVRLSSAGPA